MKNNDAFVEDRSFDWVPPSERTGNYQSQTQLCFMVNAPFSRAATGTLTPFSRRGLSWNDVDALREHHKDGPAADYSLQRATRRQAVATSSSAAQEEIAR
ncbi:hypothetical protein Q9R30_13995 [Arthrobacter sp. AB6]|uniref:hypothetical protein n=1 Tax=Arthrobacter sp. AB6 TaxID=2962570 RepID=UPI002882B784|nr:hypothetical protein [Arthrobacter sp. AB6]MDT0196471.1 hypothetical protein [Arthrobacter sp. AB6]